MNWRVERNIEQEFGLLAVGLFEVGLLEYIMVLYIYGFLSTTAFHNLLPSNESHHIVYSSSVVST